MPGCGYELCLAVSVGLVSDGSSGFAEQGGAGGSDKGEQGGRGEHGKLDLILFGC